MARSLAEKFGQGPRASFGSGNFLKSLPTNEVIRWSDFSGGFNASDAATDIQPNGSPASINIVTDQRDRLRKAPGTTEVEEFDTHTPNQLVLHGDLASRTELLLFDAPYLGVKSDGATVWTDIGLPNVPDLYSFAQYGEDMLFLNGVDKVWLRKPNSAPVQRPTIPNGTGLFVFNARLFVGGAIIDGSREPLGVRWTAVTGDYDFDGETSGFELLLTNDTQGSDRFVVAKPIGFDTIVVLNRKSIWLGRRTTDADEPAEFSPLAFGKGCAVAATAKSTLNGVIYLSDDGVEVCDGNSTRKISQQIDSELFPLDPSTLAQYSAAYNPATSLYYLFTPEMTFIYDCSRGIWFRRDFVALGGTAFATQYAATKWSDITDHWADHTTDTWRDYLPAEADIPDMMFLGDDAATKRALHKEDQSSYTMFGNDTQFLYSTQLQELQKNIFLATHKAIRLTYTGDGTVKLYLPDETTEFEDVGTVPLPAYTHENILQTQGLHSGLGVALQVEFMSGDPLFSAFEVEYLSRGKRLDGAAFVAREYQADF